MNIYTRGITLVELLISLTIIGILFSIAIPGFANLIDSQRTVSVTNMLVAQFARARSEAITKHQQVTLCSSADGNTCLTDSNWSNGMLMFFDSNRNEKREAGEQAITVMDKTDLQNMTILTNQFRPAMAYRPDGITAGTNMTMRICSADGILQRQIIINMGGRARLHKPTTEQKC